MSKTDSSLSGWWEANPGFVNAFNKEMKAVPKDELKKRISLLEYVESRGFKTVRVGSSWRINPCPICSHQDHFSIAQNSKGEWYYNSFSDCVKGGDIFNFVIEVEKAADRFPAALEYLQGVWNAWQQR